MTGPLTHPDPAALSTDLSEEPYLLVVMPMNGRWIVSCGACRDVVAEHDQPQPARDRAAEHSRLHEPDSAVTAATSTGPEVGASSGRTDAHPQPSLTAQQAGQEVTA